MDALGLTRSRFIEDRAPAALLHQISSPLKKIEASSPDESPKRRSPACISACFFDLWCMAYVPHRFPNNCDSRRLTEGQLLRSASVKRKSCGSPTKNGCANLTPLRLCRYFTDNDAGLVTSCIVQRNM